MKIGAGWGAKGEQRGGNGAEERPACGGGAVHHASLCLANGQGDADAGAGAPVRRGREVREDGDNSVHARGRGARLRGCVLLRTRPRGAGLGATDGRGSGRVGAESSRNGGARFLQGRGLNMREARREEKREEKRDGGSWAARGPGRRRGRAAEAGRWGSISSRSWIEREAAR